MNMTTLETAHVRIHGVAAGWAFTAVLQVVFLVCAFFAFLWPTSALGQGWMAIFAAHPDGLFTSLLEAALAILVLAWLITGVFVGVYNCLLPRSGIRVSPDQNEAASRPSRP
jgi:hypothetical protein